MFESFEATWRTRVEWLRGRNGEEATPLEPYETEGKHGARRTVRCPGPGHLFCSRSLTRLLS